MVKSSVVICCVLWAWAAPVAAQWSTTTRAHDGLFVCDGFEQGLVTFSDGSSLVSGALSSYVFLQKLDPRGYAVWPTPVMAMHNDSANIYASAGIYDDGDGGAFLVWSDHRHAILQEQGYLNESLYGQHVDRNGVVRWPIGGVEIMPASRFPQKCAVTPDGQGGLYWFEVDQVDSGFPWTYRTSMSIFRLTANGGVDQEIAIDSSSAQDAFNVYRMALIGDSLAVTLTRRGRYQTMFFSIPTRSYRFEEGYSEFSRPADGHLFRARWLSGELFVVYRYTLHGGTDWVQMVPNPSACDASPFRWSSELLIPDRAGGVYLTIACGDTIYHFDSLGHMSRPVLAGLGTLGTVTAFSDGNDGIVAISDPALIAQRWNASGQALWPPMFRTIEDKEEAYSPVFQGDGNGGILIAYWTILGGIRVQHTGRTGRVGVLTGAPSSGSLPAGYALFQNYPNPFNPTTTIGFELPARGPVEMHIFNVLGVEVASRTWHGLAPGYHAMDIDCSGWASGVYYYQIRAGDFRKTNTMVLLR